MLEKTTTRRRFLHTVAGAVTGALVAPTIVPASVLGRGAVAPSERVNLALIGSGGRGMAEGKLYTASDTCQFVAVSDPREDRRLPAKEAFEKLYAERQPSGTFKGIQAYSDFREVLGRKDIDAVHIATPDHWHVPITIAAAKAGKDMHTEKPLGISVEQDLAALAAVRKHGRIFQYGTERRSTPQARQAIELVINGRIGKVHTVYVVCPRSQSGGSATPVVPVPKGFDYDLWLGPAPEAPFCHDRCLADDNRNGIFHIFDYAIGFIAGWGAHPLDQVQWWADEVGMTIPVTYEGKGTIPTEGLFNVVTHWDMTCKYENGTVLRFLDDETAQKYPEIPGIRDEANAATFVGPDGWVSVSYGAVLTHPTSLLESRIAPGEKHLVESPSHQLCWVDCVRSRKDPVSNIESAVRSDLVSQLSEICIRTGRPIRWDPVKETIVGDDEARKRMSRPMRGPWKLS
jgi:predicted dehydrogenase